MSGLVHTESLTTDWLALLMRYGLPLVELPRVNEGNGTNRLWGVAPEATYANETTRRLVNQMEYDIFDGFNYVMEPPCVRPLDTSHTQFEEVPCAA